MPIAGNIRHEAGKKRRDRDRIKAREYRTRKKAQAAARPDRKTEWPTAERDLPATGDPFFAPIEIVHRLWPVPIVMISGAAFGSGIDTRRLNASAPRPGPILAEQRRSAPGNVKSN